MNRYDFARQFTDEQKVDYFNRKISEAREKGNFEKLHEYRVKLLNLEERMERDRKLAEAKKRREDFLVF